MTIMLNKWLNKIKQQVGVLIEHVWNKNSSYDMQTIRRIKWWMSNLIYTFISGIQVLEIEGMKFSLYFNNIQGHHLLLGSKHWSVQGCLWNWMCATVHQGWCFIHYSDWNSKPFFNGINILMFLRNQCKTHWTPGCTSWEALTGGTRIGGLRRWPPGHRLFSHTSGVRSTASTPTAWRCATCQIHWYVLL